MSYSNLKKRTKKANKAWVMGYLTAKIESHDLLSDVPVEDLSPEYTDYLYDLAEYATKDLKKG